MNAIRNLFAAFTNLSASINGLAALIDSAGMRLRSHLALEESPEASNLEHNSDVFDPAENRPSAGKRRKVL